MLPTKAGRFDFLLIGGWAVYLYTQNLKSKDIDIVIDYENLAKIKADLLSLWRLPDFDWEEFKKIIKKYKKMPELDFSVKILKSTRSFAELDLNEYAFSKLKKQLLAHLF